MLPSSVQSLKDRYPTGIDPSRITAFTNLGLRYALALRDARSAEKRTQTFLQYSREFAQRMCQSDIAAADNFYLFRSAALEVLEYANATGKFGVLEQPIAPKRTEATLLSEERERFEGWSEHVDISNTAVDAYADREWQEWEAADLIVCGSQFVKDAVLKEKGGADKCVVVPYGVNIARSITSNGSWKKSGNQNKLKVLTVGSVNLRKGAPYTMEIAKLCRDTANFRMVGSIEVAPSAERELRTYVDLVGRVPRSEIDQHYVWADVFLLPSICEGSATVTYEALAAGLPVLCTPNTGSIVEDGVEGFIVPIRDVNAFSEKIDTLSSDRNLLKYMSDNAKHKFMSKGSIIAYGDRLRDALGVSFASADSHPIDQ